MSLTMLTLPELHAKFAEVTGTPTRCPNKKFLVRKIAEALQAAEVQEPERNHASTEAEATKLVSPQTTARRGGAPCKVLPVRMETELVVKLDEAWKRQGLRSRMELFRKALQVFFENAGEEEVAALIARKD